MNEQEIREYIAHLLDTKLKWSSCFKTVDIRAMFKGDKCALICEFFTEDYRDKSILKSNTCNINKEKIDNWSNNIEIELGVTKKLNDRVYNICKDNNSIIDVEYRWSDCEYCEIADWEYNKIVIKLSRMALGNLRSYQNNMDIILNDLDIKEYNIIEYINAFNDKKFHKTIGATINKDESIFNQLTEHMLNFKDITNVVNINNKGVQKLKTVISIRDIGIIGIFMWNIDYKNKIIDVQLVDDKVLDTDIGKLVRSTELSNGLCKTMSNKIKQELLWV